MWIFYQFLGEWLREPAERWERVFPWLVGVVGVMIAMIMAYAWWTAPAI
jgi:hypothetical protein